MERDLCNDDSCHLRESSFHGYHCGSASSCVECRNA